MTGRIHAPPGLFITGTDTDVGKTYVTALMAREMREAGVRVGVYKPVASGCTIGAEGRQICPDAEELSRATGGQFDIERIAPQQFQAALAPPVAARLEGTSVDADLLRTGVEWWRGRVDLLLVEGVGGLLCPITEEESVADLVRDLGYPLIVVARLGLGTINHTLLTLEAAQSRGLTVAGVILNQSTQADADVASEFNPAEIVRRSGVPVLGVVRYKQLGLLSF